jgi:ATP/maltotriose-dependent transcriptional regulator MalT
VLTAHVTDLLVTARAAHQRRDWRASYEAFERAGEVAPLGTDDLDALSFAAWRLGHAKESSRMAERVFTQLARTDPVAAAMKANELALVWLVRGDVNIGQGWMNRARRLLAGTPEAPAHGYLAYLDCAVAAVMTDLSTLAERVNALRDMAVRLDEPAVNALGLIAEGIQAILHARTTDAYASIDEAMLSVLADQVPIEWAGDMYCIVLHHCHRLGDLPRMRAWTQSMEQWCDVSGSVAYGGVCDVHRLQVQVHTDDYRGLEDRLQRVSHALEEVNSWAAAEGFYQLGEVRRLLGDSAAAIAAFAKTRELGKDPQPGEALLRCRLGDPQAAWTAVRLALADENRLVRMGLLRAAVEIALTRGNLDEAENHCRELESHAAALDSLGLALREYRLQQSRYETAEVYEWMALAHRGQGAADAAAADAATAETIYSQLGVEPAGICGSVNPAGLTRRELDVLTAIAGGGTNRQVAQQLAISDKTVGRHLANIYAKLGVSSRTAAVSWAFDNLGLRGS